MENMTVALSVVEDLIHWPLPPPDPDEAPLANSPATPLDDAPLTAGAAEDLDEEPRERRRARCDAVRRLPALAATLGPQWARTEVVSYLLRCVEEEDAWLSFATGMTLIDFGTSARRSLPNTTTTTASPSLESSSLLTTQLFVDRQAPPRSLTLESLLPVVVRMSACADAGVRRFLVEVVVPKLFFGVPLERNVDLRGWEEKYIRHPHHSSDEDESEDNGNGGSANVSVDSYYNSAVPRKALDTGTKSNNVTRGTAAISLRTTNIQGINKSRSHAKNGSINSNSSMGHVTWDPFRINLQANTLHSAIATYLRDMTPDGDSDDAVWSLMASSGRAIGPRDYTDHRNRREAFHARWQLFLELMKTMLTSTYAASVSAAVECISHVFSCISWVKRAERHETNPPPKLLRSTEELIAFTFTTTRCHVGRAICSGAEHPGEDLMALLIEHGLITERESPSSAASQHAASPAAVPLRSRSGSIVLGRGGFSTADRDVWDLCGGRVSSMHRVVRMSLLRALPQFIDWSCGMTSLPRGKSWLAGLCFFFVCDVFRHTLTAPAKAGNHSSPSAMAAGDVSCVLESDACRDHGIAEAVLDGAQQLLDELRRPNTLEDFLGCGGNGHSGECTLAEKEERMLELCSMYRDCVLRMATLSSWKTRWLAAHRMPAITSALVELMRRVGNLRGDGADGRALVEGCVAYLCALHTEQWSAGSGSGVDGAEEANGDLRELARDDEPEVRCVVAVCAARVFEALAHGMFQLTFPRGNVLDMRLLAAQSARDTTASTAAALRRALLSPETLMQLLPPVFDAVLTCCVSVLRDPEERVRSGAAAGLSELARTLSAMIAACDLHLNDLGKATWLRYIETATAALMTLLGDSSATVRLALVSELAALLASSAAEAGRLAGSGVTGHAHKNSNSSIRHRQRANANAGSVSASHLGESEQRDLDTEAVSAAHVREGALVACLQSLARHEVWRYRERYATLLSEMCVKFLAPNALAAAEAAASATPHGVHTLGASLRERSVVGGGRPSGVVAAEDAVNPLHRFAKEELLPLLVDVLFDKVKAVRDGALESLERMCDKLSDARAQLYAAQMHSKASDGGIDSVSVLASCDDRIEISPGINGIGTAVVGSSSGVGGSVACNAFALGGRSRDDDVFINDTLWPIIVSSPRAMATYLSRSSLLRIAVRLGVDKESVLLPLLDQLGHDAVLNVRLVVAKELCGILAGTQASGRRPPKVTFTEHERNGVVLQLLRLLIEDKSCDVRDEAAKALQLCF